MFAVKAICPVLPVMMLKKAKPFRKTRIIVGEPFYLEEYYGKKLGDKEIAELDGIITESMLSLQDKLAEIMKNRKLNKEKKKR